MKPQQVEQLIKSCQVENNKIRPNGLDGPTVHLKCCIMVDALALRDTFLKALDQDKAQLVAEQNLSLRERLAERREK